MKGLYHILCLMLVSVSLNAADSEHRYGESNINSQTLGSDFSKNKQELSARRLKASMEGIGRFANERNLKFGVEEAERTLEYLSEHPDSFAKNSKQFTDGELKNFIEVVFQKNDTNQADYSALREVVDKQRAKYIPNDENNIPVKDKSENRESDNSSKAKGGKFESELSSKRDSNTKAYNAPLNSASVKKSNSFPQAIIPYPYAVESASQGPETSVKSTVSNGPISPAISTAPKSNSLSSLKPFGTPSGPYIGSGQKNFSTSDKFPSKTTSEKGDAETDLSSIKPNLKNAESNDSQFNLGSGKIDGNNNGEAASESVAQNIPNVQKPETISDNKLNNQTNETEPQSIPTGNSYYDYFSAASMNPGSGKIAGSIEGSPEKYTENESQGASPSEQGTGYGTGGGFSNYQSSGVGTSTKGTGGGVPPGIWIPGKSSSSNVSTFLVPNFVRAKAGDLIRRFKERFGDLEKIETETSKMGVKMPRILSSSLLMAGLGAESAVRKLDSLLSLQAADMENLDERENIKQLVAGLFIAIAISLIFWKYKRRKSVK